MVERQDSNPQWSLSQDKKLEYGVVRVHPLTTTECSQFFVYASVDEASPCELFDVTFNAREAEVELIDGIGVLRWSCESKEG